MGNGRFVLRQKTGHRVDAVSFAAHDLVGQIDVTLELHPDVQEDAGYWLGQPVVAGRAGDLPNLYALDPTAEHELIPATPPVQGSTRQLALRVWRTLRGVLRGRRR